MLCFAVLLIICIIFIFFFFNLSFQTLVRQYSMVIKLFFSDINKLHKFVDII